MSTVEERSVAEEGSQPNDASDGEESLYAPQRSQHSETSSQSSKRSRATKEPNELQIGTDEKMYLSSEAKILMKGHERVIEKNKIVASEYGKDINLAFSRAQRIPAQYDITKNHIHQFLVRLAGALSRRSVKSLYAENYDVGSDMMFQNEDVEAYVGHRCVPEVLNGIESAWAHVSFDFSC